MEIEQALGADIAMAFDECAPADCDRSYTIAAMNRTHRWAKRCKESHTREDQALFGIVQGGMFADLRIESAKVLSDMDFRGTESEDFLSESLNLLCTKCLNSLCRICRQINPIT